MMMAVSFSVRVLSLIPLMTITNMKIIHEQFQLHQLSPQGHDNQILVVTTLLVSFISITLHVLEHLHLWRLVNSGHLVPQFLFYFGVFKYVVSLILTKYSDFF